MGTHDELEREVAWAFEAAYAILKRSFSEGDFSLTKLAGRMGITQSALSQQFRGHSIKVYHRAALVYAPAAFVTSELHHRLSEIYRRHYDATLNQRDIDEAHRILDDLERGK